MKAQVSAEFLVVYSALFAIFLLVFTVYLGGHYNLVQIQDSASASRNARSIAAAINYVYLAGDGASYNMTLSNFGNSENVSISNYTVTSTRVYSSASAGIINSKINSSSLTRGNVTISNNQGEIDIAH
ncbi:MAG: hypothetical protein ACP5N9_04050 [Candidatus Bilamarchaeum sp.]|jgi:hypothetical protein